MVWQRRNLRTGIILAVAILCSLALTILTITPPTIPTDWALLTPWGIYIPQRVDYPWPSYALQVGLWLLMVGALIGASRQKSPVSSFQFPEKSKDNEEKRNAEIQPLREASHRDRDTERKSRRNHPEVWILVGITLVGFALRLHGIRDLPLIIDEIGFAAHASDILHGQFVPIFAPGHNANPSVYSWLVAGAMGIFGQNTFAIRLIPLAFGTLSIPAIYVLGKQWWSGRVGLIAAAFLATYPAHIFYSRTSLYNIVDPFFAMLALAFLGRALQHPSRRQYWIFAGMMAGIAQYFYHGSRLVLVLMAVYVLLGAIKSKAKGVTQGRKEAKTQRGLNLLATWRLNIFWVALAFGVMALPRFAPMLLNNLPMTGNEKAMRLPLDLGMNSLRAALAWVGKSDLSPFWLSSAPLLQWFAVLAFGIGLAVSLWRWRDGRYAVLILSVILTTIFGGAIWTAAPLYVRYMTAVPAIALLVAVGVSIQEKNFTTETQSTQRKIRKIDHTAIIQIIVVAAICGQGIWAAMAQLPEAKGQIRAELWEEDRLAKKAAALPSGMAAVLMASAGFGAKPPDPRVMEAIGIAHYVAAYGERRAVVLNWDGGKILDKQLKRLKMDYTVIKAYPEAIFQ